MHEMKRVVHSTFDEEYAVTDWWVDSYGPDGRLASSIHFRTELDARRDVAEIEALCSPGIRRSA